ncbi:RNA-guided endonuclease InsQ/TnpB family protein [Gloeocapsopsis dulcis]|uniref:Transposase n=1 Tax=Gloeocapsopsis dulcis AAB1 = 1H9 TaxID=1433147 RepID=A0A6N8G0K3_9CHRO|nr:RNA-guided endonuclease TnpB family protein [Gloeocapsopsis dulcis]MUL38731.1 transposase [Gloeocapsopsis dulcis AAB1 = 1H9]WNN91950.1 transposase [Gloeocapsopsis dulcis]
MYGCQQVLLHPNNEIKAVLEFICQQANSLINCGIYYARQLYFKAQKLIGKYDLEAKYKSNKHFKVLYSQSAQQILRSVAESFESFKKLKAAFNRGELADKPRPPSYRKSGGLALVTYPKQALRVKNNSIRIPLGKQVKCWFGIDSFTIPMPSNLEFANLRELRILPRNGYFYAEFVYQRESIKIDLDRNKVLGIDPGLNNWLTCVSNIGKSFIIDGHKLKTQNQWYNKRVGKLKKGKPQGFWSEELAVVTEKRNRQMRDNINKAARFLVNWCLKHRVGTIVFGWNQRNKDGIEIGKKKNQEFVQVPTAKLKERIKQLSEQSGIEFVETEESYTSKSSFLDNDILPTYDAKLQEQYQFSGKRGQRKKGKLHNLGRGGYQTTSGIRIDSDCNGAANILKKVAIQLGLNLAEIGRAVLILPQRYDVFLHLSKSYRKQCEAARFQTAA